MTLEDQVEYKTLIEQQRFEKQGPWEISAPSDHSIYKSCQASPTWAKYVFIKALDISTPTLDTQLQAIFGSLRISDFEQSYHAYNPEPAKDLKRKATDDQLQRPVVFGPRNASSTLSQTITVNSDLQRIEGRLKEFINGQVKDIRATISDTCAEQGDKIKTVTEQMSMVIDKMNQLMREHTEQFNVLKRKIDRSDSRLLKREDFEI